MELMCPKKLSKLSLEMSLNQPVENKPKEQDRKNEQKNMKPIMHPKLLITPLQIWNNSFK